MIIEDLNNFYEKKGISALHFNCHHYNSCFNSTSHKEDFSTTREPYVGRNYGKPNLPKLLFLSLDPGYSREESGKTIIKTRIETENWPEENSRGGNVKGRHWYRTHQFTWEVFNQFNILTNSNLNIGEVNSKKEFINNENIHKIQPFFAHTNSAKCCMNNEKNSQASNTLFKNCRDFIIEEISIFNPNILVTQGNKAREVIEEGIKKSKIKLIESKNISNAGKKDDFSIIEMNNQKLVWIHHYHPNNYGQFKKIKNNYENFAKEAIQYLIDNDMFN